LSDNWVVEARVDWYELALISVCQERLRVDDVTGKTREVTRSRDVIPPIMIDGANDAIDFLFFASFSSRFGIGLGVQPAPT
jgi:hypothetical protein